eukprot:Mycagemm_TRINITY_DN3023_c0_g2::TRINITY_DN3023_c0_g2_i1::g.2372::m.2372 type:complete len:129 gc:universal TRINITY_DN3023_c0_g2_i1:135-521(+)
MFFDIGIPGCNIFIADRPVDSDTVFEVCFKIYITQTIRLASPHNGFSPNDIRAKPVKTFLFFIRRIHIIHPVLLRHLIIRIVPGQKWMCFFLFNSQSAIVLRFPGCFQSIFITCNVFQVFAFFKHEHL